MEKILSYPISAVYYVVFLLMLVIFHPIQWVCLNAFGYNAHKKSVSILNWFLMRSAHILGTTYKFTKTAPIPEGVPLIIVANHQSMNDIPPIIWFMRKFHPKFISKKELGKGIPSVSYNLRHGGSVLIDRKDPKQALPAIKQLAQYIEKHKRSAVIFPEGTRSKTGEPKRFSENGLKILCKYAPSAYIVPVSINNSWKLFKFGQYPLGLGNHLTITVQEPFAIKNIPFEEVMARTEREVKQGIKN
ncbi:1-acyl-sn-glycerol-3-phosphate acyltransferase [Flavobacterium salilacus subsp. salilacus]|uniref:lysophospholipid acyltransferase family protein n=1 Tax=Flavobacterium TaxID=237 RepID=UPI00107584B0|nr:MULTISPECIES: lysophospholipid acyltransferase family protein [Flavobacterium]KAF2518904.1 1-acyl-sn-glycerol-3-phosphate acyltransferase [Flavobacterium salilacus subsp. salilacus]MBE1614936.1 1-acyl-sn-glycerol-3-phosphate acyltransferase [Flavobacterium sp. SaA2.13]